MGAPAPSLRLLTPVIATNAAIVLHGNFVPTDHGLRAVANGEPIQLDDVETWVPFDPINPGSERYFLVRPASGSWPATSRIVLEVHRLPLDVPRSNVRFRSARMEVASAPSSAPLPTTSALAHQFEVATRDAPARIPPIVGAFGRPYEQMHRMPIYGDQLLLHIAHDAMTSATSPVLWLEIGLDRDRNEFETWFGGAVVANRAGVLALRPFGGGLIPALAEARVFDTTGASVVFHPPR
jgi:hypothetical protein